VWNSVLMHPFKFVFKKLSYYAVWLNLCIWKSIIRRTNIQSLAVFCFFRSLCYVSAGTWSISHTRHLNVGHGSTSPSPSSAANTSSTSAGSSSRQRRKSGDDILHHQQASSPSRKPATILDAFRPRSKSDASRTKKPGNTGSTIISQMKSAMQVYGYNYTIINVVAILNKRSGAGEQRNCVTWAGNNQCLSLYKYVLCSCG